MLRKIHEKVKHKEGRESENAITSVTYYSNMPNQIVVEFSGTGIKSLLLLFNSCEITISKTYSG